MPTATIDELRYAFFGTPDQELATLIAWATGNGLADAAKRSITDLRWYWLAQMDAAADVPAAVALGVDGLARAYWLRSDEGDEYAQLAAWVDAGTTFADVIAGAAQRPETLSYLLASPPSGSGTSTFGPTGRGVELTLGASALRVWSLRIQAPQSAPTWKLRLWDVATATILAGIDDLVVTSTSVFTEADLAEPVDLSPGQAIALTAFPSGNSSWWYQNGSPYLTDVVTFDAGIHNGLTADSYPSSRTTTQSFGWVDMGYEVV